MSRHSFRPQLEQLEGRCLPSASPALSISSVAHPDGISGQTAFVFTVSLSKPSSHNVSVNFATADGTATVVDKDYVSRKGMLTFAPGQTAKTITVLVNGNPVVEPDETFFVKLSGARYASIANATGVGTIQNNTPTAVDDYYTTDQVTPVSGNVLANDIGPTGDTLTVSTVNGTAANVSTQITLASGALLTVLADGIYVYDPNGAFNYLAPGQAASDSFTYTAADSAGVQSNTATVTITVYSPIPVQPPGDTGFTPDNPYYPNC